VFLAALELGERMLAVAQVDHEHIVVDINVQMLVRQPQVGGRAFHIAHDAARVRCAFHQQFTRAQQQIELP
jgi:hypothetical protein